MCPPCRVAIVVILLAVLYPLPLARAQCPCETVIVPAPGPFAAFRQRLRMWFGGHSTELPPAPLRPVPVEEAGGMLLKTGAFQLGPGVGKDLLRSQGDGFSGFWD